MRTYVYALLDWGSDSRARRALWTHPRNQHLPHSYQHYVNLANKENDVSTLANRNLSCGIWQSFSQNENIYNPFQVSVNDLAYRDENEDENEDKIADCNEDENAVVDTEDVVAVATAGDKRISYVQNVIRIANI